MIGILPTCGLHNVHVEGAGFVFISPNKHSAESAVEISSNDILGLSHLVTVLWKPFAQ